MAAVVNLGTHLDELTRKAMDLLKVDPTTAADGRSLRLQQEIAAATVQARRLLREMRSATTNAGRALKLR